MIEGRLSFWQRVQLACGAPRLEAKTQPVAKPAGTPPETWCPVCFLSWEEQSDWHGLRPAGEAELCDPHMRRLADFAGDDRGFAQRVILRLHIRAARG